MVLYSICIKSLPSLIYPLLQGICRQTQLCTQWDRHAVVTSGIPQSPQPTLLHTHTHPLETWALICINEHLSDFSFFGCFSAAFLAWVQQLSAVGFN